MSVQVRSDLTKKRYFLEAGHSYKKGTVAQNGTTDTSPSITDTATYNVDLDGLSMGITVTDNSGKEWDGVEQTVLGAADGQTVNQAAQLFNESLSGCKANIVGGHVALEADAAGLGATIQVTTPGTMNAVMGFPTTVAQGAGIGVDGLEMFTVMVEDPNDSLKLKPMTVLNSADGLSEPVGLLGVGISKADWAAGDISDVPIIKTAKLVNEDLIVLQNSLTLNSIITGTTNWAPNYTIRHALQKLGIQMAKTREAMAYENA